MWRSWRSFCEQTNEPTLSQRRRRCKSQETKKEKSFVIWRFEIFCYLRKNRKTKFVVKLGNIGLLTPRSLAIEQKTDQFPFNSFAIAIHWENEFFEIMILILTLVVAIINLDSLWK